MPLSFQTVLRWGLTWWAVTLHAASDLWAAPHEFIIVTCPGHPSWICFWDLYTITCDFYCLHIMLPWAFFHLGYFVRHTCGSDCTLPYARCIKYDHSVCAHTVRLSQQINVKFVCRWQYQFSWTTLFPLPLTLCYYGRPEMESARLLWLTCRSHAHSQVRRLSRSYTTGCSLSPAGSGLPSLRRTMEWPSSASLTIRPWRTSRPRNIWKCSVSHQCEEKV